MSTSPESRPLPNVLHLSDEIKRQKADDPFAFLRPESVQELRDAQERFIEQELRKWHPDSIEGREQAREAALNNLDWLNREYLRQMGVGPHENDYEDYLHTMHQVSINQMSQSEWSLGATDVNGNRTPGGRQAIGDLHDEKVAEARQSISHRLNGATPTRPDTPPKIDVPGPDDGLDAWTRAAQQAQQAVDFHRQQMDDVLQKAAGLKARTDTLLRPDDTAPHAVSPDTTQPVSIHPNVGQPDPNQTKVVSEKTDPKMKISREAIEQLDVQRSAEIQTAFNHLFAARERLATLANTKGGKTTPEYQSAQREWAHYMAEYGRLRERQETSRDPNRTHEDFVRDATKYAIDQISRLDALSEQKKDSKLHRRFINAVKKSKVVQGAIMGVTFGAASLAQKKDPFAAAAAAAAGALAGPKLMEGMNAAMNGNSAIPHTSYSPDILRAIIKRSDDAPDAFYSAARFLGERFTKGEKERRKKAGRRAVLGGLATTVALISTSMLPEHIGWHGLAGTETIDGNPIGHDGSASATRPEHNPFDIDNSGEQSKPPEPPVQPETPKPPVQPEQPETPVQPEPKPPTPSEIPPIFTPEVLMQGMNVPLEWGDGALAVGERLGLDPDQQQRFLELLSQRHDGSTYMGHDGVRLYFNGGALHLSPADLLKILNP